MVTAYLDLVAETGRQPTIEEVADAAEISVRSVYRLFPDADSLIRAAVKDRADALRPLLQVDVAPTAALPARIAALVARRARAYDQVQAFRSVVKGQLHLHPAVAELLEESRTALRSQAVGLFGKELSKRTGAARNDLVEAVELITGWSAWDALRRDQGLSAARARRVVESSVLALLTSNKF